MFLIVPPQVYIERVVNGQFNGGYLDYWPEMAFYGIYPEGNLSWHHLWFLPYLLLYSVLLAPLFLYLRKNPGNQLISWLKARLQKPLGLYWAILPLYLTEAFLEPFFPVTHALVGDWFTLTNFIILFFYGFLFMMVRKEFWHVTENNRRTYLALGLAGFGALVGIWVFFEDSTFIHFTEAGLKVFNLWTWILVLFGYASHYLNKPSKVLSYANNAVYPFYILHQTITIFIGYYLLKVEMAFLPAITIMTLGTFALSWGVYEVCIRPWSWIRPLFGMKTRKQPKTEFIPSGGQAKP
jgi:hypothetical protein